MTLMGNAVLNMYSILLLCLIFFQVFKSIDKKGLQHRVFVWIIITTILALIIDTFSRFDGYPGTIYSAFNFVGNFGVYLLNPILGSLWLVYSHLQIFHLEKRALRMVPILVGVSLINALIVIGSQIWGWYYYIDANNIYHRGDYFMISAFIPLILIGIAFFMVIMNREKIEKKYFYSLVFFPIFPIVFVTLQILIYGISMVLNGLTISLLVVFLNIQNRSMDIDYLTGVYNRKSLETYMRDKINTCTGKKTFSAILLDIDRFKLINDQFGHGVGDEALEETAKLLRNCLEFSDFIARYGGDEFYIILDRSNQEELNATINKIREATHRFNTLRARLYQLNFSMGFAVYDFEAKMNVKEFQAYIDQLMYDSKKIVA
ncbi:MAG: hypothetical protein CVU84_06085 [Firmicutes bacterium HGW-Firmicutes-1]|jgi:diguanylate cyclase (GGDEF)-like protein|nr:MAG: hypothetical protein CVU84_06085 [Firmicutes bacterium HGW-Firmicutes-1]